MKEKKKPGRPSKSALGPATINLTTRLRPETYDQLKSEADANRRSISAQAEWRILQPEVGELGRFLDLAIKAVEQRTGKTWRDGPEIQVRIWAAINSLLTELIGNPINQERLKKSIRDDEEALQRVGPNLSGLWALLAGGDFDDLSERKAFDRDLDEDSRIGADIAKQAERQK